MNSHRFNVEDDVVLLSVTFELDLHLIRDKEDNREVLDDDFWNLGRELEPMEDFLGEDRESHGTNCAHLKCSLYSDLVEI